jgi:hypothetical protein
MWSAETHRRVTLNAFAKAIRAGDNPRSTQTRMVLAIDNGWITQAELDRRAEMEKNQGRLFE